MESLVQGRGPRRIGTVILILVLSSWLPATATRAADAVPVPGGDVARSQLVTDEVDVVRRSLGDGEETAVGYVRRGAGAGHPALFVLGGPYAVEWFGRWIEPSYDVVYVALPPTSLLFSQQVADLEAVRQHLGLESVSIFGHSHDGATALEYAAAHPEAVARVIWVAGLCDQQHSIRLGMELLADRAEDPAEKRRYEGLAGQGRFDALDLATHLRSRELGPSCPRA